MIVPSSAGPGDTEMPAPETHVRAGVVGTGLMGGVHSRAILATGGQLVGVVGSRPGKAARLASTVPGARAFDSVDALLDQDLDVVHICTPNATHRQLVMAAIRRGCHVVCEKPLATDVSGCAALVEAAAARGVVATVPFVYRFYPAVRWIREQIAHETGNRLWLLHGSYLQDWMGGEQAVNWRLDPAAGGASRAFGDVGVHWCDLMEFVTGQRITKVLARFAKAFDERGPEDRRLPVQTEDGATVMFQTDQDAIGSVVISQASAGRKNRLWFSFDGPRHSYSFDQERPESLWVGGHRSNQEIFRDPEYFSGGAIGQVPLPAGHPEGYAKCFENFVADTHRSMAGSVVDGLPTFADGLRAAQITAAVVESARTSEWTSVPAEYPESASHGSGPLRSLHV